MQKAFQSISVVVMLLGWQVLGTQGSFGLLKQITQLGSEATFGHCLCKESLLRHTSKWSITA